MMAFWSGKQQALNVDDLRNLQINGTWSDTIPVKPRGGDVFCYTTTDANKKDDWKADQYRWRNYGVKLFPGKSSLVNKTVFHVQTREGVRPEFRRISYQYLSEPSKVVIQYVGDSAVAEAFPHGNSNDASSAYVRSCPSLLASLKLGVQSDVPSNIYKRATGTDVEPVLQPVMAPRNSKQVENAAYLVNSNKRLSQDSIYNLVEIAYDLQSFVHKVSVFPHLTVICGNTQILKHCNLALLSSPTDSPAILSYDTTFCLGDFYVSVLLFRMTVFNSAPVIPALFLIHDCKTSITHQEFFSTACHLLSNLSTTHVPLVTDQEQAIVKAITSCLPHVTHLLGWNHLLQDIKRYVKTNSCEIPTVRDDVRSLMLCTSEESYSSQLADEVTKWPQNFAQYFMKSADPVIRQKLGRWVVGNYGAFDPYSGLTTNQSEGFNTVMKRFQQWKEATVDSFVLAMHRLQTYYGNEIERGLAGLGNYRLLAKYTHEMKDPEDMQIMDAYLELLQMESKHIFFRLPSTIILKWSKRRFGDWLFTKVKFQSYRYIILPACFGASGRANATGEHWMLLVVNMATGQVAVLNSVPSSHRYQEGAAQLVVSQWTQFMEVRCRALGECNINWTHVQMPCVEQRDSHSCGIFALMNAEVVVRGLSLSAVREKLALVYRQYVAERLMQADSRKGLPPCAMAADCCSPAGHIDWVHCDGCHLWLHFECVGITCKPDGDFFCPVCLACAL